MLAQYKYRGNEQLAPVIASMLLPAYERLTADLFNRLGASMKSVHRKPAFWHAVTYVPISPERAWERGFNQAEQLASYVSRHSGVPLMNLLQRSRHTGKQSFKSRVERIRNTRQLFEVIPIEMDSLCQIWSEKFPEGDSDRSQAVLSPLRVLLIDDIYTTGSTAEECAKALLAKMPKNLEIYVLTWARS